MVLIPTGSRSSGSPAIDKPLSYSFNPMGAATTALTAFYRHAFSRREPGNFQYTTDDSTTEILIDADTPDYLTVQKSVPSISVLLGAATNQVIGHETAIQPKISSNTRTIAGVMSGSWNVMIGANKILVVHELAWTLLTLTIAYRQRLQKQYGLDVQTGITIAPSQRVRQNVGASPGTEDMQIVPLIIPFVYRWSFEIVDEDFLRFSEMGLNIEAVTEHDRQNPVIVQTKMNRVEGT